MSVSPRWVYVNLSKLDTISKYLKCSVFQMCYNSKKLLSKSMTLEKSFK